jgi:hypothetical protein
MANAVRICKKYLHLNSADIIFLINNYGADLDQSLGDIGSEIISAGFYLLAMKKK